MKTVKTEEAVGMVLCHDLTQIIKDEYKGSRFKKGHVVQKEDIPILLSMGKEHLYVWEKNDDMLHEDEAAKILAEISAGENIIIDDNIREGKISIRAAKDGVLITDLDLLKAVNSVDMVMMAAKKSNSYVKKNAVVAAMRVIPLIVKKELMEECSKICNDNKIFKVAEIKKNDCAIIATGEEVLKGRIKDTFTPVLSEKLSQFGYEVKNVSYPGDDVKTIEKAIKTNLEKGYKALFLTGGMSVDPDDNTPLAIKNTTDQYITYGAPVLPGAMFMLCYKNDIPVIGLPGCVMYAKKTVFDLLLPRIAAGIKLTKEDIVNLCDGGLL